MIIFCVHIFDIPLTFNTYSSLQYKYMHCALRTLYMSNYSFVEGHGMSGIYDLLINGEL